MTWLDALTMWLYLLHTVLVGIGWEPFAVAYNRVIIELQEVSE